jgi:hypothetical protein
MIAEAARRGQADMSLVSVDSAVARAHHDAAGMVVEPQLLALLEEAAVQEKGATETRQIAPSSVDSASCESKRAERRGRAAAATVGLLRVAGVEQVTYGRAGAGCVEWRSRSPMNGTPSRSRSCSPRGMRSRPRTVRPESPASLA